MNRVKRKIFSRIKDENWRLAVGEEQVQMTWKNYFEDLYNMDTQEQVVVPMCGSGIVQRDNYFEGETVRRTEVEMRVG